MSIRIVGIGGSSAAKSSSRRALELALEAAAECGAQTQLVDVSQLRLPFLSSGINPPEDAHRLAAAAASADALIWSSPTYHGTISAAFKNAVDWLEVLSDGDAPYLSDKPVGLIATAAGTRGIQTVHTMSLIAHALRAWPLPFCVTVGRSYAAFDDDGTPRDPDVHAQLGRLGQLTVSAAHRFKEAVATSG